jgi:DNA-binding Lrp family transcriptional regulator
LRKLYEKARFTTTYTLTAKQDELSTQLGISRQAYNVHLRKLKNRGLRALGISSTPAFILIKVSPTKRVQVYDKIKEIAVWQAFRVAGEVDALIMVEREQLDDILKQLCDIDGVQDTRSYVTIETLK